MMVTTKQQDRVLLGGALLAAVISASWFGWRSYAGARNTAAATGAQADGAPYAAADIGVPRTEGATWAPPPAQSRGPDWVYEVFTPPEIYYDTRTRQFSVTAPSHEVVAKPAPEPLVPFGLELAGVRRAPYRLQLVGYVGGEGNYRGTFQNMLTTETFLAGADRRIPGLGLEILSLDVRRQPVPQPGSLPTNQMVASATVRDEATGEEVALNSLERRLTDTLIATVRFSDAPAAPRELRSGDALEKAGASYKITKIQLAPPAVTVTKEAPDQPQPDTRTLTPTASPANSPPPSR